MLRIAIFLIAFGFTLAQDDFPQDEERKVKGQQYVTQTVVAKVIGPNGFSNEFLEMIKDENTPIVVDNTTFIEGLDGSSALVTENVKTTVTRITIPLSSSFIDSDWYRESLRKFLQKNRLALSNKATEKEYRDDDFVDLDLINLKLWAAATLRDNIISVFGTVLYGTSKYLPDELHSALTHLYELTRLRRIPTVGFLDALEKMSFEDPQEQFKILFQTYERYVPKYLRSCVTYWLEYLFTGRVNVNDFLTSKDGVLIADFLTGIDSSALIPLKEKVLFPKSLVMHYSSGNYESFGKMLTLVLTGIYNGSIPLTPQLFTGILLHLPLNTFTPEADEYQRYFVDLVKQGDANYNTNFQNAAGKVKMTNFIDPYELSKAVFKSLMSTDLTNRELYAAILINIRKATGTFSLRNYDAMAPLINSEQINMEILLRSIVPEEYPLDIVDAKNRLLYYIDKNYIDFEFVLRNFVKHQESTPTELLIAALTRIEVRSKNLFPELLSTVTSLKAHIIYKQALTNLRLTLSVTDVATLLLSFQSPDLPQNLRDVADDLRVMLPSEFIDPDFQLNQQSTAQCSRPRQCVINILKYMLTNRQIQSIQCEMKVRELLQIVDDNGEPMITRRFLPGDNNCISAPRARINAMRNQQSLDHLNKPTVQMEKSVAKEIYPGKYNPSPYKNSNFSRSLYKKPLYISRLNSGRIMVTGPNEEVYFVSPDPEMTNLNFTRVPIPHPAWINSDFDVKKLLPVLDSEERAYMMPVERLLNQTDLTSTLNITSSSYSTRGALLMDILNKSLQIPNFFNDEEEKNFVKLYLTLLEYTYEALPPPPPTTSKYFTKEVNIRTLFLAIPLPADHNSQKQLEILKSFLFSSNLASLKKSIDANKYASKGAYLKHLLQLLLENYIGPEDVRNAIRYFQNKVMTTGYGAQPVDWIIVMESALVLNS